MKYRMYKKGTGYIIEPYSAVRRADLPYVVVDMGEEVLAAIYKTVQPHKREFLNSLWSTASPESIKTVRVNDTNTVSDKPTKIWEE